MKREARAAPLPKRSFGARQAKPAAEIAFGDFAEPPPLAAYKKTKTTQPT